MNDSRDTVALLTPPGTAALAVVRITGQRVRAFLAAHCARPIAIGRLTHAELRDIDGSVIDDPVIFFAANDVAEISLHGGTWVIDRTLAACVAFGFEHVGEMSTSAVTHTIEEDVLAALPDATTELAVRVLLAQPKAWAKMSAGNDADALRAAAEDTALARLLRPPKVALVGIPNAGKSTLANALYCTARSITAEVPGTTRDYVADLADVDGLPIHLIDTAGVRETDDALEAESIRRGRIQAAAADLIVVVIDITQPLDVQLDLVVSHPAALLVVNKLDRPPAWERHAVEALPLTALNGGGVDTLRTAIASVFGCANLDLVRARAWTPRQRADLRLSISRDQ